MMLLASLRWKFSKFKSIAFINLKSRMPFGELTSNCSLWLRFCTSSANSFRMGVVTWGDMSLYLGIVKENGFKHLWVLVPDFNCPLHYWGVGWVDPVKQHHVGSLGAKYSPQCFSCYGGFHQNLYCFSRFWPWYWRQRRLPWDPWQAQSQFFSPTNQKGLEWSLQ